MEGQEGFHNLLFNVDCSVRYHSRRRQFFENLQQSTLFLAFLLTSGAMTALFAKIDWPVLTYGAPIVTTVILGVALVVRAGAKANDHNDLKRRFINLQRQMESERNSFTPESVDAWAAERLAIEADEPPINRVIHALVYNELVKSKPARKLPKPRYVQLKSRHKWWGWTGLVNDGLALGEPEPRRF